jgi:hypothetical protein
MLLLEESIIEQLRKDGPCCLDDIVTHLPSFSWGEIFLAVDRMSRDGRVMLHQRVYSTYQLSLGTRFAHSSSMSSQTETIIRNVMPQPKCPMRGCYERENPTTELSL